MNTEKSPSIGTIVVHSLVLGFVAALLAAALHPFLIEAYDMPYNLASVVTFIPILLYCWYAFDRYTISSGKFVAMVIGALIVSFPAYVLMTSYFPRLYTQLQA